eukprot:34290_4
MGGNSSGWGWQAVGVVGGAGGSVRQNLCLHTAHTTESQFPPAIKRSTSTPPQEPTTHEAKRKGAKQEGA